MAARKTSRAAPASTAPAPTPVSRPTRRAVRLTDEEAEAQQVIRGEFNSKQVEDPFKQFYATLQGDLNIVEPPLNFAALMRLMANNAMLRQCIEAMVTNVEGHGYRMIYVGPDDQEQSDASKAELEALEGFFDAPNDSYSLIDMRSRCRWDLETLGNCYIEVARNPKGEVTAAWHIPAHLMRLTHVDSEATKVKALLPRKTGTVEQTIKKHFRRFVQIVGTKRIYFKEFGDPRQINPENGQVSPAGTAYEDTATEIIHIRLYSPGSAYGVPRWHTQLPSISGSRQVELTNLEYFTDNAVPAMIMTVAGGQVDQTSLDNLEEHLNNVKGRKAQNRIVTITATGDEHAAAENGTIAPPKIEIKSLQGDRQADAIFQNYEKDCHTKVRSSFRLPPIFVGQSEDYTHATAKASFEVAENQVFGPERSIMDDMVNRKLLATWDVKFWQFRSNPPRIADPEEMLKAVETFEKSGAMTPNVVIGLANEMFDLDIPQIDEDWGDWPFEMVKALGAAGRLKGMEDFVKEAEIPPALGGESGGKPGANPKAPGGPDNGKDPTPFTGEGAKKEAQRIVRDALVDLRQALTHPAAAEEEMREVVREDGTTAKVRHRARR